MTIQPYLLLSITVVAFIIQGVYKETFTLVRCPQRRKSRNVCKYDACIKNV